MTVRLQQGASPRSRKREGSKQTWRHGVSPQTLDGVSLTQQGSCFLWWSVWPREGREVATCNRLAPRGHCAADTHWWESVGGKAWQSPTEPLCNVADLGGLKLISRHQCARAGFTAHDCSNRSVPLSQLLNICNITLPSGRTAVGSQGLWDPWNRSSGSPSLTMFVNFQRGTF